MGLGCGQDAMLGVVWLRWFFMDCKFLWWFMDHGLILVWLGRGGWVAMVRLRWLGCSGLCDLISVSFNFSGFD